MNIRDFLYTPSQADRDFLDDCAYRPRANWKPPHTTMPILDYSGTLPPRNNHNIMLAVGMLQCPEFYKPEVADEIIIYSLADTFRAIVKRKIESLISKYGLKYSFFDARTSEDAWDRALERICKELHSAVKVFDPIRYYLCGEDTYLPEVYERVAAGENLQDVIDELAVNGLIYDYLCEYAQRGVDKARSDKNAWIERFNKYEPIRTWSANDDDLPTVNDALSAADYKMWRERFRDRRHRDAYLDEWKTYCIGPIDELIMNMRLVQEKSYEEISRVVTKYHGKCGDWQVRKIWFRIVADHKAGVGPTHGWPDDFNIR